MSGGSRLCATLHYLSGSRDTLLLTVEIHGILVKDILVTGNFGNKTFW